MTKRLQFIIDVGLPYLSLNRSSKTLSGGEAQRIRLATQIGTQLTNVLYVLDEPSIGLHQRDNLKLSERTCNQVSVTHEYVFTNLALGIGIFCAS